MARKKNLKVSALKFEISTNVEKVLKVLEKFKFIEHSDIWMDSNASWWLSDDPSEEDMDKVLKALGY